MRRLILRFLCLHECRFDSLLTACSGGHLLIKTKRYALLLQVENLRNFHPLQKNPPGTAQDEIGSERNEDRHGSFTQAWNWLIILFLWAFSGPSTWRWNIQFHASSYLTLNLSSLGTSGGRSLPKRPHYSRKWGSKRKWHENDIERIERMKYICRQKRGVSLNFPAEVTMLWIWTRKWP